MSVGLGTAEQLVRSVTELRIEAARHARGFIEAEDRQGHYTTFPLTTVSIGAVYVTPGMFHVAEDVASAAAAAKHHAKRRNAGLYIHAAQSGSDDPADTSLLSALAV